ncbi:MAG TPA: PDZ domain-containing protein, partial [Beijerinckiaceae bacterium]
RGALVAGVDDKGPAKPAGIEVGDVIVKFDGQDVRQSRDLPRIVANTPVGKAVDVTVVRKGKEVTKSVTLGRLEDNERQASLTQPPTDVPTAARRALGLELSGITDELRRRYSIKDTVKGVVVTRVDPNSAAADKRIQAGEVIGINTAILSPTGGSVGIGFAVPAASAVPVIQQLREFGETRRGWLGVRIQNVDDPTAEALGLGTARGALVAGVDDKGPAKPAGLEVGDVIVKFDGQEVKQSRDLPRIVANTPVGKAVDVTVVRKGKEVVKSVTLGRLEDNDRQQQASLNQPPVDVPSATRRVLGLELSGVTDEVRKRFNIKDNVKGVVVTRVDPNSAAADKRIQPGEVIVEVGQEAVASPADVTRRVEALKKEGKKSALLLVANAQGEVRFVAVSIE